MFYKNIGVSTRKHYGKVFAPNAIHEVPGYINDPFLVPVDGPEVKKSESEPEAKETKQPQRQNTRKSKDSSESTDNIESIKEAK